MSLPPDPIQFDFSSEEEAPREFLSGQPVPPPKKKGRGRKSTKEAIDPAEAPEIPETEVLYSRQYWSISEVAAMFKVNISQIRYWENEFDILEPRKNRKGDRFFRPIDVQHLELIYDLLRRRKFTLEGARSYMKKDKAAREKLELIRSLERLRTFLLELKANL